MKISETAIAIATGCTVAKAKEWHQAINDAADKWAINTPKRAGAWLANIGVETGGLEKTSESLNYSAQGLADTWPNRYSSTGKRGGAPNALASQIARNPTAIANYTYANRMGNGAPETRDGWNYRGQGLIQLTGKDNWLRFAKATGMDVIKHPELISTKEGATASAAWFWVVNGCNELADKDMFSHTVKKVNGAPPNEANHGALRLERYRNAVKYFNGQ